jgi:DnaJ-class molecular chaperone
MRQDDYYSLLGLGKDASAEEIKKAFRRLAHKFHPDKNNGDKKQEEKFKEIKDAYDTLNDPYKKAIYDRTGTVAFSGFFSRHGNFGPSVFAKDFGNINFPFAGKGGCGRRGGRCRFRDSNFRGLNESAGNIYELPITADEALSGAEVLFSINSFQGGKTYRIKLPQGIEDGALMKITGTGDSNDIYISVKYS